MERIKKWIIFLIYLLSSISLVLGILLFKINNTITAKSTLNNFPYILVNEFSDEDPINQFSLISLSNQEVIELAHYDPNKETYLLYPSPNGDTYAYYQDDKVFLDQVSKTNPIQVLDFNKLVDKRRAQFTPSGIYWSIDGDKFAISIFGFDPKNNTELFNSILIVTKSGEVVAEISNLTSGRNLRIYEPQAWSKDGLWLVENGFPHNSIYLVLH